MLLNFLVTIFYPLGGLQNNLMSMYVCCHRISKTRPLNFTKFPMYMYVDWLHLGRILVIVMLGPFNS